MNNNIYILIAYGLLILVCTLLSLPNDLLPQMLHIQESEKHFLMMGQFNYHLTSIDISTWIDAWSKVIETKDIIMAVTDCESHDYPIINSSSYLCYKSDSGYYSPYINIAKVMKKSDTSGILYIHDDMLITSSLRKKLGKSSWVITSDIGSQSHDIIKIYKNGTVSTNDTFHKQWPHWNGCLGSFIEIINDPDMSVFLHASNSEAAFIHAKFGQSDLLYAYFPNNLQKEYFINILGLFAKHKLFLECALPTAVLVMKERFGIQTYDAHLCTSWDYGGARSDPDKLIQNCDEEKGHHHYEAYHPIKLSRNSNWSLYFDRIYNL